MSANPKQQKFILLRADGITFEAIAKEVGVTKSTLIQWSKLYQSEIEELQFHSFMAIKEAYSWSKKERYETLLKQLQKIDDGILNADLSEASLKDIFTIKNNIMAQLDGIERGVKTKAYVTTKDILGNDEMLEMKLSEA